MYEPLPIMARPEAADARCRAPPNGDERYENGVQRKRLGYILIGSGLMLALFVGIMVYSQVSDAERVKASLPTARVVIATADIPARTEIAASMVNVATVPDQLVQAGAATKVEDVVGKFSPDAVTKGAVINTQKIGPLAVKNAPSFRIEKGKVMYVMPVAFAGSQFSLAQVNALRAGDRVDLLYTTINAPQGMSTDQREEVRANTIFIVKPEEALVLKWLKDAATYYKDSNIEMVLRSPADEEQADNTMVVNFNYMREKYNLAPPPALPTTG